MLRPSRRLRTTPAPRQQAHRLGDLGVGGVDRGGDVAHTQLARFEQGEQDAHPGRVAEQSEHRREIVRLIDVEQRTGHRRDQACVDVLHHTPIQSTH